ncbi:MAG: hypothetical protein DI570_04405 [Phenylobacterium zucineum]|nr:MAG: hypothetical protein DI570_04405 [Phenylobacterium zucineum]
MKVAVLIGMLLSAGVAHAAEPVTLPKPPAAALNLSTPSADFAVRYAQAPPGRTPGIARTAIDRRLDGDDVTGSLGFMCGLKPGADRFGVAAARGWDPTGRFVGARLSVAFR